MDMNENALDLKREFLDKNAEMLREKFIVCYNSIIKEYKDSDLLLHEEIAPALLHTAQFAAFNFLTYLGGYYASKGYEKSFFDDFQKSFAIHCETVLKQVEKHALESPDTIAFEDKPILIN